MSARYETIGVELEFVAPLVDPDTCLESDDWILRGKIDGLCRDLDTGEILIVEHKTAASDISPGSDYWKRLRLDSQISLYYDGATALGYEPTGILYDVLAKPALRLGGPTKKRSEPETHDEFRERFAAAIEANPASYMRSRLVRFEDEIDKSRRDVWQTATQLARAMGDEQYPRNPGACWKYNSMCEFFPVCSGEASLDDPVLFRKREGHSELSDLVDDHREALTNSRISLARECQRAHLYRYVECYETTARRPALAFGTLVHAGLEAWWSHDDRLGAAIEVMRACDVDPLDLVRAEALLCGYHATWADQHPTAAQAA